MFNTLPTDARTLMTWPWDRIQPFYADLLDRDLTPTSVDDFLRDWSQLGRLMAEVDSRYYVAITVNTADAAAQAAYDLYLDTIYPAARQAGQDLKRKLLDSGVEPANFAIPLRNMRAEADLFREENLPLLAQELKLESEFEAIIGGQTVTWQGEEIPVPKLRPLLQEGDRSLREAAWRAGVARQLQDRERINQSWQRYLTLRQKMAANAGFDSYRDFRWRQLLRFDYSPADCKAFRDAIEAVMAPAARRLYERQRATLVVESLRPWDVDVDALGRPPLHPNMEIADLTAAVSRVFHRVDPILGDHFDIMRREDLLDLESRKNKGSGGYCTEFHAAHRPFIFMNAVGMHDDVQTLLHEGGHAFHVFETAHLPYLQQLDYPMEFAEVASMAMELLAAPYLAKEEGGLYSQADAHRALVDNLENSLRFWPYMAVVDGFQHWVYEHPDAAMHPANCDRAWGELWDRFMVGIDFTGLETEKVTGWQRKSHIHTSPFYYVEYGMAQLGAVQVWRKALDNQADAVAAYRQALALGGTASLPDLYRAAGVRFAFDEATLRDVVGFMEEKVKG